MIILFCVNRYHETMFPFLKTMQLSNLTLTFIMKCYMYFLNIHLNGTNWILDQKLLVYLFLWLIDTYLYISMKHYDLIILLVIWTILFNAKLLVTQYFTWFFLLQLLIYIFLPHNLPWIVDHIVLLWDHSSIMKFTEFSKVLFSKNCKICC